MSDIKDKIRKILNLAKDSGATELEAQKALAMAQKLMLQHNIQEIEEKVEVKAVFGDWLHVDMGDLWEQWLAVAVAKMFNCRVTRSRSRKGSYQFVGKPDNIAACEETFPWVGQQIEVLYKEALRAFGGRLERHARRNLRRTFKQGCAVRVSHRINEIIAKARNEIPAHMALVVIDQSLAAADELIKDLPKSKSRKTKAGIGTVLGYKAGDRVQIQRSVETGDK